MRAKPETEQVVTASCLPDRGLYATAAPRAKNPMAARTARAQTGPQDRQPPAWPTRPTPCWRSLQSPRCRLRTGRRSARHTSSPSSGRKHHVRIPRRPSCVQVSALVAAKAWTRDH